MEPTNFRHPERWNTVVVPERVARRAIERIDVDDNGCWISRYSVASHGYAQIGWSLPFGTGPKTRMVLAHRAAWTAVHGQVPLGMTLDHTCKQRRCVNPAHLRLLPNFENARRTSGKDWPIGSCINGHSAAALQPIKRRAKDGSPRWGRTCSECVKLARHRYNERKRAERKESA